MNPNVCTRCWSLLMKQNRAFPLPNLMLPIDTSKQNVGLNIILTKRAFRCGSANFRKVRNLIYDKMSAREFICTLPDNERKLLIGEVLALEEERVLLEGILTYFKTKTN